MDRGEFNKEMARLNDQWPNAYRAEKTALIWTMVQKMDAGMFREVVDLALLSMRGAPLAEDFSRIENEVRNRAAQARVTSGFGGVGMLGQMQDMAKSNKRADPEFVALCLKHLRDFISGKITKETFEQGCQFLDETARQLNPMGSGR